MIKLYFPDLELVDMFEKITSLFAVSAVTVAKIAEKQGCGSPAFRC